MPVPGLTILTLPRWIARFVPDSIHAGDAYLRRRAGVVVASTFPLFPTGVSIPLVNPVV